MAVVVEVNQLITPLCYDPKGILQKCNYDQKPANCRQVSMRQDSQSNVCMIYDTREFKALLDNFTLRGCVNLRFYWIAQIIQEILNLARLLPNSIKRAWVATRHIANGRPAK